MQHRIIGSLTIAGLLIGGLQISCVSASTTSGATYYVDVNHPRARDRSGYGNIDRPWKTPKYAFQQLKPGDTLLIRGGIYQEYGTTLTEENSGQEGAPITVKAYPGETVVLKDGWAIKFHGANWWTIDGLVFDNPKSQYIQLGLHTQLGHNRTVAAEHITIKNCEFKNGNRVVIRMHFANDILVENNYLHHVRPGVPFRDDAGRIVGWEMNAIDIAFKGNHIVIRNNRFEEIGSDGVHLGAQFYLAGSSIGAVSIINNEFWVNRPYEGILGNVGENAIDIKRVDGPILVSGNTIHGFRPTTPEQDASGAWGEGIVIHNNAQNIIVERNLFFNNTAHLVISQGTRGTPGGTRNIMVRNNIFREARRSKQGGGCALRVTSSANVEVYHNTFHGNDTYLRSYDMNGSFKNNVIVGGEAGVHSNSAWEADYNAWARVEGNLPQPLRGEHDVRISDPWLRSDLCPLQGSPLIDVGENVGVSDDFDGFLRTDGFPDLGAIEWKTQMLLPIVAKWGMPPGN